jgi:hypothetical protein
LELGAWIRRSFGPPRSHLQNSTSLTLFRTPGTNATTGEHVDLSDLGLVGAQLDLVKAVKAAGKPTVVVFVSGKPVAEPWIQASACCCAPDVYVLTTSRCRRRHPTILSWRTRWSVPSSRGFAIRINVLYPGLALAEVIMGAVNPSGAQTSALHSHFPTTVYRQTSCFVPAQCWNHSDLLQLP